MQFTVWPCIYDKDTHETAVGDWPHLVAELFSSHTRVSAKDKACGFGPYISRCPLNVCKRHQDAKPRAGVHRCDSCVETLTAAVYDADTGTAEDIQRCDSLLQGLAHLWYTTFSHTVDKPSYRLILPFARPVDPEAWPSVRLGIIRKYRIPCDESKCSGRSHFYYLPSCPAVSDTPPRILDVRGELLDPASITPVEVKPKVAFASLAGFSWEPPPEPTTRVELTRLKTTIFDRASALKAKGETVKAGWLFRLVRGDPLAEKGSRNESTFKTAGMLAWMFPRHSLGTLLALMRPSVEAMVKAGSSLQLEDVERMLCTAMRNKAEAEYLEAETKRNMKQQLEDFRAGLFRAAGLGGGTNGKGNEAS